MTTFRNVNRALLFGVRSELSPREEFPLETGDLPAFVALPMGTASLPSVRGCDPPRVHHNMVEHDIRKLFPQWMLDSFARPPMLDVALVCTNLANMAVTIPQLVLYERRDGRNYVKNHMLPASLTVLLIILNDLGDCRRAQALCEHLCPEVYATGRALALTMLTCLDDFYATTRCELPTLPQAAEKFNVALANSALHLINTSLFPSAFHRTRTICLALGPSPAQRFHLSLPASIVLLNLMLSESALWAKDVERWSSTLPSALSLRMNSSLPENTHLIFNARMMPAPIQMSSKDVEIPIPPARTLTNIATISAAVLHTIRRRHDVLSAARENGSVPPLPSSLANLMTNLMMPSADVERVCTMSDDDLYLAHVAGATLEEMLLQFIFRDTVAPHRFAADVLDLFSPAQPNNPLRILSRQQHVVRYASYATNHDMRGLACLDPQMIVRAHSSSDITNIINGIQCVEWPIPRKHASPVWSHQPLHCRLETTPLRSLAPGSVPVCHSKSPLAAIAHIATLNDYVFMDKLTSAQIRYILAIRYLARQMHSSCLLGAPDRLFDLETDSAAGCALITRNTMRLLVLHMAYYSTHQYYRCSNTLAVPLARELLCLPQSMGLIAENEGEARFVDELSTMIVLNLTRYATMSLVPPRSADLPIVPRYGFTRIRHRYKIAGSSEYGTHVSGLSLPLLECLVRPLLTGDHINRRPSFSVDSGSHVAALSEWMAIMSDIKLKCINRMAIPSKCVKQLIVRFAYIVRIGQLSAASGPLTRAGALCNQNLHMVHSIMMLALSMYDAERGVGLQGVYHGMDPEPDDASDLTEEEIANEEARELASASYDNGRAYLDEAKTRPLWASRHNSTFLSKFYSIPLEWFFSTIITSNEKLQHLSESSVCTARFTCATEGRTERAAAMSATFGICFGDVSSLSIGQRAGEKDISDAISAIPSGPERDDLIADLEESGGRLMPKISRVPSDKSVPNSKRHRAAPKRKTGAAESAHLNYAIIDRIGAFGGGKIAPNTKACLDQYMENYEHLDKGHVLFDRLCRDHNVVTGRCPREMALYYSIAAENYRQTESLSQWIYLFHLMAFVMSWSLHASRPTFSSFSDGGERIEVVPECLFHTILHSMKLVGNAGKHIYPRRKQIDTNTAKMALGVSADAPPQLFDGSSPWTLRPGTPSDSAFFERVILAIGRIEAAAQSKNPEPFIRPELISLPPNWLGAALPMIIDRRLVHYGVDWPSLKLTEAEFKETYFDLAKSEELRNVAFLVNNCMPIAGVSRTADTPLRASAPHVCVFDNAHRCLPGCLATELLVSQKGTNFLRDLAYIARKEAAASSTDIVDI